MRRFLARFRRDQRGLALIEFAFVAPVLALLFVGGYQLMDATSAYRKVTTTDRALADLTTQNTSITKAQAQSIMAAAQQIMAPYPAAKAVLRISQINIDPSKNVSVDWSQSLRGTAYAANCTTCVTVPNSMRVADSNLIYAEIDYSYVPNVASGLIGTIPLHEDIFMSPRNSEGVTCNDC